ncbi:tyrosine-type recombinase/integrase [Sphaerisporangium krabiense]|uniref:tyrosine-type recombinase/integrase n=1 Tax=Sphaerisporangium krabiense TaxID=763782 RepID=UPI00288B3794|nr:tyrosine-type recombinase/integrase [Sphaerisporangium krabiense]
MLQEHLRRRQAALDAADVELAEDAFVFSPDPASLKPWNPDTITHKYERHARAAGIRSSLKELRHYSATQLLSNGIDLRTVAGRLGHAGGGVTTLRFYAQFVRPADQQAAAMLSSQLTELRKRERLWELFNEIPTVDLDALSQLATDLAPKADLDEPTASAYLQEFAQNRRPRSA